MTFALGAEEPKEQSCPFKNDVNLSVSQDGQQTSPSGTTSPWTSSWEDKFPKRQLPPQTVPERTGSRKDKFHGQELVWGEVVQGELVSTDADQGNAK